jgi:hypothetical protein
MLEYDSNSRPKQYLAQKVSKRIVFQQLTFFVRTKILQSVPFLLAFSATTDTM